eukprot:SAG31_NODE_1069_length_10077_cov_2.403588_12_plen_62_part_00
MVEWKLKVERRRCDTLKFPDILVMQCNSGTAGAGGSLMMSQAASSLILMVRERVLGRRSER